MADSSVKAEISILIIDDEEEIRSLTMHILKNLGYPKTIGAGSAAIGLQKIEAGIADIVFCDLRMPGMGGIELLRELRASDKFKNLPFVLLTSSSEKQDVMAAIKCGTTDYIVKASTQVELKKRFCDVLERIEKRTV